MRCLCLINPLAGGGAGRRLAAALSGLLASGRLHGEVAEINPAGLRAQCAALADYDAVLVGGGDGTLSALLPYLTGRETKTGLLPLGTANDLARELGVFSSFSVRSPGRLIEAYRTMPVRDLQIWSLHWGDAPQDQILFCNYVSFGYDAGAVADFAAGRRRVPRVNPVAVWLNRLGYGRAALGRFRSGWVRRGGVRGVPAVCFSIEDRPVRSLFFSNIRSVMGLGISRPDSDPFDGRLEATVVKNLLNYAGMLCGGLPLGRGRPLPAAAEWSLEGLDPDVGVQVDGEGRDDLRRSAYRIRPAGRLRVMTPR